MKNQELRIKNQEVKVIVRDSSFLIHDSPASGMTLVEVLIAVAIFAVVMLAVTAFGANIFSYRQSISGSLSTVQDSQIILKTMLREMRGMAPGANGVYALASAGTSSVAFFSDADGNGVTEKITYSLVGNTMYRAVIQPSGSPPVYNSASQSTTTLIVNVRNSASTPVFQYFDTNHSGTSTPLVQPVTTTAVRLIKISLTLDVDPNKSPTPITYTTQVNLRNLKSNL